MTSPASPYSELLAIRIEDSERLVGYNENTHRMVLAFTRSDWRAIVAALRTQSSEKLPSDYGYGFGGMQELGGPTIPQEIIEAEAKVSRWFAERNIQQWELGGSKKR